MAKKKSAPAKAKSGKPAKNKKVAAKQQAKPAAKKATAAKKAAPKPKAAAKPKAKVSAKAKPVAKAKEPAKALKRESAKAAPKPAVEVAPPAPKAEKTRGKGRPEKVRPVAPPQEIAPQIEAAESEVILTNADGKRYCKVGECDELATSDSYCRYHYLLNWKKIQLRKKILAGDKLNRYIEELTARYPDKYLEMIRKDLTSDKDFLAALQELEIDEGSDENEYEDDTRTYIDEVRGVGGGSGTGGGEDQDEY